MRLFGRMQTYVLRRFYADACVLRMQTHALRMQTHALRRARSRRGRCEHLRLVRLGKIKKEARAKKKNAESGQSPIDSLRTH